MLALQVQVVLDWVGLVGLLDERGIDGCFLLLMNTQLFFLVVVSAVLLNLEPDSSTLMRST